MQVDETFLVLLINDIELVLDRNVEELEVC